VGIGQASGRSSPRNGAIILPLSLGEAVSEDFRVGAWLVQPSLNSISGDDSTTRVEPKVMAVLVCLASHSGEALTKEDLLQEVWQDTFVTEDVLKHAVSELRRVFEDDARDPHVIQTIPKRGYRLVLPVRPVNGSKEMKLSAQPTPRAAQIIVEVPQDSIAVLPFVNMSGDPENEFFADGTTEEIINALAQIKKLRVVARTSSFSFKGKHVDLRTIGEQLNVRTVLEGSVRRAGEQLRITVQLVNVSDGYHLWSEKYDRTMKDIFAIQEDIARSIAERLKVALGGDEQPLVKAGTQNLEAYQAYIKGRALFFQRGPRLLQSLQCMKQAVALDANYAMAWAAMADAYNMAGFYGLVSPEKCMPHGKEAALRAVAIQPSLAQARAALAVSYMLYDWDWPKAEQEFLLALELNPRYAQARIWYAVFSLQWVGGRHEEGIAQVKNAGEHDPLSYWARAMLACTYLSAGKFDEAVETAKASLLFDPDFFLARWYLIVALTAQGRYEEAAAFADATLPTSGRHPWVVGGLALIYSELGEPAHANALYMELQWRAKREYVIPTMLAVAASAVGEQDKAMQYAEEALTIGDPLLITTMYYPTFARLCQDPRFLEILARRGWK
jgi:adenylate cyclase